jgi:hypothetical protein
LLIKLFYIIIDNIINPINIKLILFSIFFVCFKGLLFFLFSFLDTLNHLF